MPAGTTIPVGAAGTAGAAGAAGATRLPALIRPCCHQAIQPTNAHACTLQLFVRICFFSEDVDLLHQRSSEGRGSYFACFSFRPAQLTFHITCCCYPREVPLDTRTRASDHQHPHKRRIGSLPCSATVLHYLILTCIHAVSCRAPGFKGSRDH